ncbi:MAG: cytochrome c oxidase accessory protein CcoG [Oligoflexia bacterium]|nr:cytochrome c oxidase accessory protein CcoG [Oligoflexia bacterium]
MKENLGLRQWVYAEIFSGPWRARRRIVATALIAFYLLAPWIRVNGQPFIQFDLSHQRFFLLGNVFFFNELGLVVPLILATVFLILAITSALGRIWCGWACPQSVFLEFVYRPLEKLFEGRATERKHKDQTAQEIRFEKYFKYASYLAISLLIGNTFISYFSGTTRLFEMISSPPAQNMGFFITMTVVTAGFMFNFSYFREQMCTFVCPYGRLQSVLLDKDSLIVGYDTQRGEPRGKSGPGDCVDCKRCLIVCPTGIDIREGVQLECIHCTACVDACNDVMSKMKRRPDLIKYTTQNELNKIKRGSWTRPAIYIGAAITLIFLTGYKMSHRRPLDIMIHRSYASTMKVVDHRIENILHLTLRNKSASSQHIQISSPDLDVEVKCPQCGSELKAFQKAEFDIIVLAPKESFRGGLAERTLDFETEQHQESIKVTLFGMEK